MIGYTSFFEIVFTITIATKISSKVIRITAALITTAITKVISEDGDKGMDGAKRVEEINVWLV